MAYDSSYVTLRFRDAYGRTKTKRVELYSQDAEDMEAAAAVIAAEFQEVSDAHIETYFVTGVNNVAGSPAAGSNIDAGVTVSCLMEDTSKAALKWPCPTSDIIASDGSLILTDADVIDVEELFQSGVGQVALLSDGETVVDFLSGQLDK